MKNFYTGLASTSTTWEKHSKSQSLQPKQKKPYNIGSQTFSDGTPFVDPILSPTKS